MGLFKRGSTWWIRFTYRGRQVRRSTETDDKKLAEKIYHKVMTEVTEGKIVGLTVEKVTFDELAEDLMLDYRINEKKSIVRLKESINNLKTMFDGVQARDITTTGVKHYILKRQQEGAENATVNRELSALKRMFSLARQNTPPKIAQAPYIPKLQENNVRTGFYEYIDYVKFQNALPDYLKPVFLMGYFTGMRKGEILGLTWAKVNIFARKISLEPSDTKNKEPRIIFLYEDQLYRAILKQKMIHDQLYRDCPYVFCKDGKKINDFRCEWDEALRQCGHPIMFKCKGCKQYTALPNGVNRRKLTCQHCGGSKLRKNNVRVFHDTRRTAVRNLSHSGTPEKIAMKITGHKTRIVFDRYNIVDEDDLKEASVRLARQHQEMKQLHEQAITDVIETGKTEEVC